MTGRDARLIEDAVRRLRPLLEGARTAALCTHVDPDGDGIGAELCLLDYLRGRGIAARVINTEPLPLRYRFLDPDGAVETFDAARHDAFIKDADLIVVLDNSSVERLGPLLPAVRASRATTVCIDHHNVVEPFWKVNIIDEDACATGELVYQVIKALGGRLTARSAQAAYVSMVTDTGYFRFSKTSPRCHEAAAEMLAAGVSPPRVYEEVYERDSAALVRLTGMGLAGLRIDDGGRLAWMTLTRGQMAACGADKEDTSEIINELLRVDGVRIAVLFKELGPRRTKLSFRSKGNLDVNRIAGAFGGGGHTNAAGAVLERTLAEATEAALAPCRDLLKRTV